MLNTVWLGLMFIASLLVFIFAAFYASGKLTKRRANVERKRKEKRIKRLQKKGCDLPTDTEETEEPRRLTFVTPFHKFLFGVFFAGMFLFFPYYWTEFAGDFCVARFFKMLLLSAHNTARLFILDGDFVPIQEIMKNATAIGSEGLLTAVKYCYSVYAVILYVLAPFMTAGVVLSLFKGMTAYFKYQYFKKADEVYLISELNERSIELARDILSEERISKLDETERKKKRIVVFAEVFDNSEERSFELIAQALELGAFCFKRDLIDVGLKRKRVTADTQQKIYFIGENEDENVEQALLMIEACRKSKQFNTKNTHFYVYATTVESETLLDFVDNGNMRVRRINENKDLAMETLLNHDVFAHAAEWKHVSDGEDAPKTGIFAKKDVKLLRVLIVGLGNYGTELLKMLCWSCQMFTYALEIYVFDKCSEAKDRISRIAPDLLAHSEQGDGAEQPYYKLVFVEDADVTSGVFYKKLDEFIPGTVTSVFVTLGEDELNIQTAIGLRTYFGRRVQEDFVKRATLPAEEADKEEWQMEIPQIFSVVYSAIKNRIFREHGGLKDNDGKNYAITFIGSMTERYSLKCIEQEKLMALGKDVHCRYEGVQAQEGLEEWIKEVQGLLPQKSDALDKALLAPAVQYLQGLIGSLSSNIAGLDKKIQAKATELLKGVQDAEIAKAWTESIGKAPTGTVEEETAYITREIEYLNAKIEARPANVLIDVRREDCKALKKLVEKRRKLLEVCKEIEGALAETPGYALEEFDGLHLEKDELTAWDQKLKAVFGSLLQRAEGRMAELKENVKEGERKYDRYEYFRSSSIATAIHEELRARLYGPAYYEARAEERFKEDEAYAKASEEERAKMRKEYANDLNGDLEHLRWQAYMWAQGYQKGAFKSTIDKTHPKLVAVTERLVEDKKRSKAVTGGERKDSKPAPNDQEKNKK